MCLQKQMGYLKKQVIKQNARRYDGEEVVL